MRTALLALLALAPLAAAGGHEFVPNAWLSLAGDAVLVAPDGTVTSAPYTVEGLVRVEHYDREDLGMSGTEVRGFDVRVVVPAFGIDQSGQVRLTTLPHPMAHDGRVWFLASVDSGSGSGSAHVASTYRFVGDTQGGSGAGGAFVFMNTVAHAGPTVASFALAPM